MFRECVTLSHVKSEIASTWRELEVGYIYALVSIINAEGDHFSCSNFGLICLLKRKVPEARHSFSVTPPLSRCHLLLHFVVLGFPVPLHISLLSRLLPPILALPVFSLPDSQLQPIEHTLPNFENNSKQCQQTPTTQSNPRFKQHSRMRRL